MAVRNKAVIVSEIYMDYLYLDARERITDGTANKARKIPKTLMATIFLLGSVKDWFTRTNWTISTVEGVF